MGVGVCAAAAAEVGWVSFQEQKPESLKEPLEIQFVGSTNDCTIPDESTLNQEDVDKVGDYSLEHELSANAGD
jgi:hypothetical protein